MIYKIIFPFSMISTLTTAKTCFKFQNIIILKDNTSNSVSNCRNIQLNLMRNLVEVRHETKEAVFEVLGSDGVLETYKVGLPD